MQKYVHLDCTLHIPPLLKLRLQFNRCTMRVYFEHLGVVFEPLLTMLQPNLRYTDINLIVTLQAPFPLTILSYKCTAKVPVLIPYLLQKVQSNLMRN